MAAKGLIASARVAESLYLILSSKLPPGQARPDSRSAR